LVAFWRIKPAQEGVAVAGDAGQVVDGGACMNGNTGRGLGRAVGGSLN